MTIFSCELEVWPKLMNRLSKIPLYLLLPRTHGRSRRGSNAGFTVVSRLGVLCALACFLMPPLLLATSGQTNQASCETPLIQAIRWRKWEEMRRLIRTGADEPPHFLPLTPADGLDERSLTRGLVRLPAGGEE